MKIFIWPSCCYYFTLKNLNNSYKYFKHSLPYIIPGRVLDAAFVAPTSEVRMSPMLLLLQEIRKDEGGVVFNGKMFILNVVKVGELVHTLKESTPPNARTHAHNMLIS